MIVATLSVKIPRQVSVNKNKHNNQVAKFFHPIIDKGGILVISKKCLSVGDNVLQLLLAFKQKE